MAPNRNISRTADNPLVLIGSPDVAYARLLMRQMEVDGYDFERCHDPKCVLRQVARHTFDVILLDLDLDEMHADGDHGGHQQVDLISFIRQQNPSARLILLFDPPRMERAIEGIRRGAYFYLPKSCQASDVALTVAKAMRSIHHEAQLSGFEQSLMQELLGGSPAMQRVIELIGKVSPTDSTVLLLGESGTGKDLLANTIHRLSNRRERPFVAVNCAALPETLLESELFGHVQGAFTGAHADKHGLFEEADEGTIFLDEIGDMALVTQAKLLRVLQNGEVRRVGDTRTQRVNVRVIAATNQNLEEAVRERRFREDLYFRLNVVTIRIPPLRDRGDSLPRLVQYFLTRANQAFGRSVTQIDEQAMSLLIAYPYPGNVRELESIMKHAVIMAEGGAVRVRDLPEPVQQTRPALLALPPTTGDGIPTIDEMEADLIRRALETLDGNQTEAALKLGISRSTLWRKMKQYGISAG